MGVTRKQHYVPQFYLRNFSCNGKSVGTHIISSSKTVQSASIKEVAYEDYLYGKDGVLESRLANCEGLFATIVKKIIDNKSSSITDEEFTHLVFFVLFSDMRTQEVAEDNNEHLVAELRAEKQIAPELFSELNPEDIKYTIPNLSALQAAIDIAPLFNDLSFMIIVNNTDYKFITSDNPVALYNPFALKRGYQPNWGYGQFGIQIFMPLSPTLCLFFWDDFIYDVKRSGANIVLNDGTDIENLNKLFFYNANKFLYFEESCFQHVEALAKNCKRKTKSKPVVLGNKNAGFLIPYERKSVTEQIKLSFVAENPALTKLGTASVAVGTKYVMKTICPLRPTASDIINRTNSNEVASNG